MPSPAVKDDKIGPAVDQMAQALFAAYRFISQPTSGGRMGMEYRITPADYNRLVEQMRLAMRANNIPF